MLEIRFHGRGGQGAVTAATLLGKALELYENKRAIAFPAFGTERRGAPVMAFVRADDKPVRLRSQVYNPNVVMVLDDSLLSIVNIGQGVVKGGLVIINTLIPAEQLIFENKDKVNTVTIDATGIALDIIKRNIVNTSMLGALCAVSDFVKLDSVIKSIENTLPQKIVESNVEAAKVAYKKTKIISDKGGV